MEPSFTPTSGEERGGMGGGGIGGRIRGASELQRRGIEQIAAASININGPCETADFQGCSFGEPANGEKKKKKGGKKKSARWGSNKVH